MDTTRLTRVTSSRHTCTSLQSSFNGAAVLRRAPPRLVLKRASLGVVKAAIVAEPAKLEVKSLGGQSVGSESLSLKVASSATSRGLLHRYIVLIRQNARQGTASTKTRAEVRGGGKKPYAQKGTGGARRGSQRTPLRPGGGVVFGPKPCDWTIKMNKKERRLALATALQDATPDMVVVQDLKDAVAAPKTKLVTAGMAALGIDLESEHALLIVSELFPNLKLASRNLDKLKVNTIDALNAYDILRADKIVIEQSALKYIQEFFGARAAEGAGEEAEELAAEEGGAVEAGTEAEQPAEA